mgnify:CR=1 FL=1
MADVVNLGAERTGMRKPSLEPLMALVGDDLAKVNRAILDRLESRVPLIPQLAGHLIASGGKRLRPAPSSSWSRTAAWKCCVCSPTPPR